MKSLRRVYISLGSNIGDRWQNLKSALQALDKNAGTVKAASGVYESPSWGFKSDPFLNACIALDTELSPDELLQKCIEIEKSQGRERSSTSGYQARTLDIDILFYNDQVLEKDILKIPHPQLQNRRFVLLPLADIAPGKVHPTLKKPVIDLLHECTDKSLLRQTHHTFEINRKNDFSRFNFVAIEGNIGSGKTTLATKIANDFNGKLILERFADNPFLPKFYEDRNRYAFPLEMSFLADRYQQFTEDTSQHDLFYHFMVSDYDIFKSLIFARVTLQEEEFKLYRKLFNLMYKEAVKPDLYVYLYQNTERLLENIRKRGRDYEKNIPASYLEEINQGYFEFMKTHKDQKILILDISDKDFVKNSTDYQEIIYKIHDFVD
ncbi:2-amino-4-hydroxy-6-hydroxymethyldihydropteridine diphosphokinase [Ascidiimonas aurantiaca]|uniref:2-amino-4-hydroxy-6- hydroxymethyldihydropteridine diphosphokinase n=1 Tax=Ascidiimonas aurantiaca TaxID=1685432 RepID=UPI0030EB8B1F